MTITLTRTATVGRRFHVVGMSCGHCEYAIETEVAAIDGVCTVTADATAGIVTIESTLELSIDEVAAAVDDAGYELAR